jgi:hypothetical protein
LAGVTSKRANTLAVVAISQLAGLLILLAIFPFLPPAAPTRVDFLWGALAGVSGGGGVALLYRALAIGVMSMVAPTDGRVRRRHSGPRSQWRSGERLASTTVSEGIVLAIVAIVLVSQCQLTARPSPGSEADQASSRKPFLAGVLSGVVIGFFFRTWRRPEAGGAVAARRRQGPASVSLLRRDGLVRRRSRFASYVDSGIRCSLAAALDMQANLLYLVASRSGPLSVVVTLASLYRQARCFSRDSFFTSA